MKSLAIETTTRAGKLIEIGRCALKASWFVSNYCKVEDVQRSRSWIPFDLWPAQVDVLSTLTIERKVVLLKARQLGMTWLVLAYALWLMLFRPQATILLFSRRDEEAMELLRRLKGMFDRLPSWLQDLARSDPSQPRTRTDSAHVFELSNGSVAKAFPSTAGDSYTATLAIIDEADLVPDLGRLIAAVKPTTDAGGQLVLLSRVDKSKPNSEFKLTYRGAKIGLGGWAAVFLPWFARPERTPEWYQEQVDDSLARTGGLDYVWEQYPATDEEALAPEQKSKRIPAQWLMQCYKPVPPIPGVTLPTLIGTMAGLSVFKTPAYRRKYVIGADTAEGNPTSDDSAVSVLDLETGEEVAVVKGKYEPAIEGDIIKKLSAWYNGAPALIERNNHGHAVILWLRENTSVLLLRGLDGKYGWLTNAFGKTRLYDDLVETLRGGGCTIHGTATMQQLAGIESATLSAPPGDEDDVAISFAIAQAARAQSSKGKAKRGKAPSGLAKHRG